MKKKELLTGHSMIAQTGHTAVITEMHVMSVPENIKRNAAAAARVYQHARIMKKNRVRCFKNRLMYAMALVCEMHAHSNSTSMMHALHKRNMRK